MSQKRLVGCNNEKQIVATNAPVPATLVDAHLTDAQLRDLMRHCHAHNAFSKLDVIAYANCESSGYYRWVKEGATNNSPTHAANARRFVRYYFAPPRELPPKFRKRAVAIRMVEVQVRHIDNERGGEGGGGGNSSSVKSKSTATLTSSDDGSGCTLWHDALSNVSLSTSTSTSPTTVAESPPPSPSPPAPVVGTKIPRRPPVAVATSLISHMLNQRAPFGKWRYKNLPSSMLNGRRRRQQRAAAASPSPPPPTQPVAMTPATKLWLCTWNLRNVGVGISDQRRANLLLFMQNVHLMAVQELRTDNFQTDIAGPHAQTLTQHYGFAQSARPVTDGSTPTLRTRRRESLGFIYDTRLLRLVGKLQTSSADFVYSPFACTFETLCADRYKFTVLNVHVSYRGSTIEDIEARKAEVRALCVLVECMRASSNRARYGSEIYVCGDFNLEPWDEAFVGFMRTLNYREVNVRTETTLTQKRGHGVYDNVWVPNGSRHVDYSEARVGLTGELVDMNSKDDRKRFSKEVSDHLPVLVPLYSS